MTDLIRRNDALDILCKSCGITEDVEKCRKTSADGWCKEYCELKNMPAVEAIPIEWMKQKYPAAVTHDSVRYISKVDLLNEIIEEWKKEE